VKICLNRNYRTIIGFENLIQSDWFLAGHLFHKRLETSLFTNDSDESSIRLTSSNADSIHQLNNNTNNNNNSTTNNKVNNQIAPVFLVSILI